ncbi:hypothetical protein N7495_000069 [Penicillium taxi]|uniref:uncharacterized protein n=1 Tax=Penicillium taxi TaxID=168475 RepID=UPI00254500C0|nr:uncharacterized protein N7495_000069 [Penicillium taxi]KAJ5907387.1 hypothetical protein N7495_000069 [Penicillium taxi]
MNEWAELRAHGAQHHAFGKKYVDGNAQNETISWHNAARRDELVLQAKMMVTRSFHAESARVPQILEELDEKKPLKCTRAAQVLRPSNEDNHDKFKKKEADTSGRESQAPKSQQVEPESTLAWFFKGVGDVVLQVARVALEGGIHYNVSGGSGGFQTNAGSGTRQNLDPFSSRDTAIAKGHDGSYSARQGYYNSWGLNRGYGAFTGSQSQGEALRKEMNKRWGR